MHKNVGGIGEGACGLGVGVGGGEGVQHDVMMQVVIC